MNNGIYGYHNILMWMLENIGDYGQYNNQAKEIVSRDTDSYESAIHFLKWLPLDRLKYMLNSLCPACQKINQSHGDIKSPLNYSNVFQVSSTIECIYPTCTYHKFAN